MSTHRTAALRWSLAAAAGSSCPSARRALAQRRPPGRRERPRTAAAAAEDDRERQAMERFLSLLEKNPRRGTALDRVYGYHVERGTLDAFIKSLSGPVAQGPEGRRRAG